MREARRMAGVLMPVASLPSRDGAGSMGADARRFVDYLAGAGFQLWQVLPMNPLGYGNSPYQPYSSYAGDELYIDLDILEAEGYLEPGREELPNTGRIDYDLARKHKNRYLQMAFDAFEEKAAENGKDREAFDAFCQESWVYNYAVFMTLKAHNGMRCWNQWPVEQRDWILHPEGYDITPFQREIRYRMFLQFKFYQQWAALRSYAASKNILMVGDVPFYVGIDSLDVWQNRETFLLDQDCKPTHIAGVPPDYFSATGQRWGNPIYNWDYMEKNHFRFWVERLRYSMGLYDIIRIDHFRAFDTYWKIVGTCETAIDGVWVEAPGHAFFRTLLEELPDIWIVAEDLGDLRPEVLQLRDAFGFPGMNVLEFTLLAETTKPVKNQVIYTGTHDNQTVAGWYGDMDETERKKVDKVLRKEGRPGKSPSYRMMHRAIHSQADIAVLTVMDILELGDEARLNTPGTVGSPNWEWRLGSMEQLEPTGAAMKRMLRYGKRLAAPEK